MVARPIAHPDYLVRVFRVPQLGDAMPSTRTKQLPFSVGENPGQ